MQFIDVKPEQTVTCKRCGTSGLVWQQNRLGKWYLTETYSLKGELVTGKTAYHNCQKTLDAQEQIARAERIQNWKPSAEQMQMIDDARKHGVPESMLKSILNDWKMEETQK